MKLSCSTTEWNIFELHWMKNYIFCHSKTKEIKFCVLWGVANSILNFMGWIKFWIDPNPVIHPWLFLALYYKPFCVFMFTVMALLYIVDFCYNLNKRHKGNWAAFHWVELWLCEYTWDGHGQTKCLPALLGGPTDSTQPFGWSLCLAVRTLANFNNKKWDYKPSVSIVWNVNN